MSVSPLCIGGAARDHPNLPATGTAADPTAALGIGAVLEESGAKLPGTRARQRPMKPPPPPVGDKSASDAHTAGQGQRACLLQQKTQKVIPGYKKSGYRGVEKAFCLHRVCSHVLKKARITLRCILGMARPPFPPTPTFNDVLS